MSTLLTSRKWNTADYEDLPRHWYAPEELLERFKSVQYAYLTDTTSSSGDWQGFFVQKIGKKSHVITFSQENNWPYAGYTLYTSDHASIVFEGEMDRDEIAAALYEAIA